MNDEDEAMVKEHIRKYEEWEDSAEGIYSETNIVAGAVDEERLIVQVLQRIPREVRKAAMENVAFVVVANCSYVQPTPTRHAVMIVLLLGLHETIGVKLTTIAHEIAHYWLDRDNEFPGTGAGGKKAEKAADDLCESWGFGRSYNNYDLIPGGET